MELMCSMITQIGCFFYRKLRYSELKSSLSKVLVTLLEEQALSSDLLRPSGQFRFSSRQTLQIPDKIIKKFVGAVWVQV